MKVESLTKKTKQHKRKRKKLWKIWKQKVWSWNKETNINK